MTHSFLKRANPGLFFVYLRSFQTKITIFTTHICGKCPSSIRCWDSNPRPLERESLPITTRPGLLPFLMGLDSGVKATSIKDILARLTYNGHLKTVKAILFIHDPSL